jgi:hypothetical protein
MDREEGEGSAGGGGQAAGEERGVADVGADVPEAVECSVGERNTLVMKLVIFLDEDYCPVVTLHLQPKAVDATERLAARLRDAEEEIVRMRTALAQAASKSVGIPALSLRTTHQVSTGALLQWNTAVAGVTCPDVFGLEQGDASVVRVRARGVYQLHVSIAQRNNVNGQYMTVLVNGEERCRSYEADANSYYQQASVFDILQLNANDAITVRPYANSSTYTDVLANRFNLTLLQRL